MDKQQIVTFLRTNKKYIQDNFQISIVALYGSYSRDEATENSDIDLVYENTGSSPFKKFIEAEYFLNSNLNKNVELVNIKYMNPLVKKFAQKDFVYV